MFNPFGDSSDLQGGMWYAVVHCGKLVLIPKHNKTTTRINYQQPAPCIQYTLRRTHQVEVDGLPCVCMFGVGGYNKSIEYYYAELDFVGQPSEGHGMFGLGGSA